MAGLSGPVIVAGQDLYSSSSLQAHALGAVGIDKLGRKYRYAKAGASALVVGNVIQSPARDTQFTDMAVASAAAIGDLTLPLTNGTTTTTLDMFKGGTAVVSVTPGLGQVFTITGNTVATSGAALSV